MPSFDLSQLDWTVEGWRPFMWRMGRSREAGHAIKPDVLAVPAQVPGSVQDALRDVGMLPDWNVGVNSRACEWVGHRHWIYETRIPAGTVPPDEEAWLVAEGLDHSGWILIDDQETARFEGSLVPHRIALGAVLSDGNPHYLDIVFEEPPREQGQAGYTSQSRHFKSRYNYSWDWCPRLVPVGIWEGLRIESGVAAAFEVERVRTGLNEDNATGCLEARVSLRFPLDGVVRLHARLEGPDANDAPVAEANARAGEGPVTLRMDDVPVSPWWPNGEGENTCYRLRLWAAGVDGEVRWETARTVGFKRVAWRPCEDAPADAAPWLCEVNGRPVFLQGANWVPPRLSYADSTREDYETLIRLYREMGCNVLRVWGGAILEKEWFYELCDAAGIFVWQEFPLSSSGIENEPPRGEPAITRLCEIARSYIARRAHHVSLLLWSGGNELTGPETVPIDDTHPCIAALKAVVEECDPDHRFIATSPTGPRFAADATEYGQGLHHDVHGPWGFMGIFKDLDDWRAYWAGDDALFRSEVGMPGASSLELLRKYSGGLEVWPPTGEYWLHGSAWWTQWERLEARFADMPEDAALAAYVGYTQQEQAEAYASAARACKSRFPRCGGFIIWMGHDLYPCPANNSVIDFERQPKPAWHALAQVFKGEDKK